MRRDSIEVKLRAYHRLAYMFTHPEQEQLFPLIREKVTRMLGGYIQTEELADMEHYIVPASLHDDQGIMGCLELARREKAGCV